MKELKDYVISIPDFPEKGIIFRDITGILQEADGVQLSIDMLQDFIKDLDFDDEKRLLIEINDKLGVIKSRLGFIISAGVILFFVWLFFILFSARQSTILYMVYL